MRRKVIILRFGHVGSSVVLENQIDKWAMLIASQVGIKLRMIHSIVQKYIADGHVVIQPKYHTGGRTCPLTQEQIDYVLDHETIRDWTPLTIL